VLCWQLSVADGLDTRRCSGNGQPVISGSKDGRIWFPNSHALAVFDPAALRPVGQALLPLLEEVIVDGEPVTPAANGEMRVTSATRGYELHYSSPTLQMPERLRFRFRLARWDPEWTDVGQRRVAYYGHLPPGEYEFNVMAGSPGGDWQAASAALRLIVVPRFWERRAVQLAGVILLLGAVGATVRGMERSRSRRRLQRAEAQQAMERERRRIARDLHDDLGGDLTEIMLLGEMAAQPATPGEKVREHAEAIATRSREAAAAMDEIIWTVNPRNDTVPRLADRVAEMARRRFDPLQAQLRVEIMEDIPDLPLPATARHALFLAMKEAQNNAAKHSRATEVRVGISCKDGCLVLTIDDNGCGFDSTRLSNGRNGLENMRQRMGSIGGALELQSQPGEGTRVRFTYAVPSANGK
jgi:signal transduction histidine kinase